MRGYHLAGLPVAAKLVYTIFLVFILLGLWSSVEIYEVRLGWDLQGSPSVHERYVGGGAKIAAEPAGGPSLDLPPDEAVDGDVTAPVGEEPDSIAESKWPWVLDVFHQHLFSISVIWLVLAHLFMLTRLHPAISGTVIILSGIASLMHVVAPVIINRLEIGHWLMPVSGTAMALTWLLMIGWSLMAMWFGVGRPAEPEGMAGLGPSR